MKMSFNPKENLFKNGVKALSNQDLLAIVLNHGTKKENVFDLVKRLMSNYGEQALLDINDVQTLQNEAMIGQGQASKIIACFELGKRLFKKNYNNSVFSAKDVFEYLKYLQFIKKEQFIGLYMNTRFEIIHEEVIAIGNLASLSVHPREVFRPAIYFGAYAIIVAHNHPSGNPEPSSDDYKFTAVLREIGELIRIPLLDHVIIGSGRFTRI